MAVTKGQGNPDWTRDETILALDLLVANNGVVPGKNSELVRGLSDLLQQFKWPEETTKLPSFRNTSSVYMKMLNLRTVGRGRGLRFTKMDQVVCREFEENPKALKAEATAIRSRVEGKAAEAETELEEIDEAEAEFPEGVLKLRIHRRRERQQGLRRKLIDKRKKDGDLTCEVCRWTNPYDPVFAEAAFEVHHLKPLGLELTVVTKLSDLALLCANCHRLMHTAIVIYGGWLSVEECRELLRV